jgi:uncharacterized spore protein YtfJ
MRTETFDTEEDDVLDRLQRDREALLSRRVFGEAYEVADITLIPVARIAGGLGRGGGKGVRDQDTGSGFGSGFGMQAQPVGVYVVRGGDVAWKPAIDVTLLARRGQVLAGIVAVCVTLVMRRRARRRILS